MKLKKTLFFSVVITLFFAIFALTAIFSSMPVFADASNSTTLDVNVSATAVISVLPTALNWTNVPTGNNGTTKYITIKNIGSLNVSNIYTYVDTLETEPDRPYGLMAPNYSAGGVITVKNETVASDNYFAGRLEWNWTQDIPNHDWSNVDDADAVAWGYFRNTSTDYVWVIGNGTDGYCNNTATEFGIEYDPDTGIVETRTPIAYTIEGESTEWGFLGITDASSPLDGYCVATYYDCSKIYIYRYDKRTSPNFASCDNSEYLQEADLVPGYTMILEVQPWIPNGYPSGDLNTTTLTVYASSA